MKSTTTTARGRGRPPLPAGAALDARVSVRLDDADAATLAALAAELGTTEADALRIAMRALAARRVRS